MPQPALECPCGIGLAYTQCCARFHCGPLHLHSPDAQTLMRSRYSAYTMQLDAYLLATWHSSTRPAAPVNHEPALRWLGLQLLDYQVIDADHAEVEFVSRSKLSGRAYRLRERSRFLREDGRWFYLNALA